jgi:hypothetical protein
MTENTLPSTETENTPPSNENVAPPATIPAARQAEPARGMTRPQMLALAGVAVLIVAVLALPRRHPSGATARPDSLPEGVEQTAISAPEQTADSAPTSAPISAAPAVAAPPVVVLPLEAVPAVKAPSKKQAASKPEARRIAELPKAAAPIVAEAPLANAPDKGHSATELAVLEPAAVEPAPAPAAVEIEGPAPVTITGCLEISVDGDEFRLTDTEGDAPKKRSWRTGFLRKRPAAVALVDPPQELQAQVGKRVAATGQLTSRELKVSSVSVVGPSCN